MFDLKNSVDGVDRLNFSIEVRVDLKELATFILVGSAGEFDKFNAFDPSLVPLVLDTKGKAIKMARKCILYYGEETPSYRIGDEGLEDDVQVIEDHLKVLWEV